MRIKLTANRQTGANGVRPPTHWRSASVVGKDEDLLPRRSAAIIGAATQLLLVLLRSYYWCCYAAIIGAATQLLLVLLRSYYWCGYHGGSAGRHFAISRAAVRKLLPRRISRGLGAVPRGARGEMHRKVPTKCACVFRFKALMSSLKFESSDIKRAHACSSYLHTFHF